MINKKVKNVQEALQGVSEVNDIYARWFWFVWNS